jgi:hypothetical protein
MQFVVGFLRFWRDFVIGDDWRVALGVVASFAIGAVLVWQGAAVLLVASVVTAVIAGSLVLSLVRGLRQHLR